MKLPPLSKKLNNIKIIGAKYDIEDGSVIFMESFLPRKV